MYTVEHIVAIREQARRLGLSAPEIFWTMPAETLAGIANGYGPDRWPEFLRQLVSWIFRDYPAPAAIHDVRYEFSDGGESGRRTADDEFSANLKLAWRRRYPGCERLRPVALWDWGKLRLCVMLVRRHGAEAWRNAAAEAHHE